MSDEQEPRSTERPEDATPEVRRDEHLPTDSERTYYETYLHYEELLTRAFRSGIEKEAAAAATKPFNSLVPQPQHIAEVFERVLRALSRENQERHKWSNLRKWIASSIAASSLTLSVTYSLMMPSGAQLAVPVIAGVIWLGSGVWTVVEILRAPTTRLE